MAEYPYIVKKVALCMTRSFLLYYYQWYLFLKYVLYQYLLVQIIKEVVSLSTSSLYGFCKYWAEKKLKFDVK